MGKSSSHPSTPENDYERPFGHGTLDDVRSFATTGMLKQRQLLTPRFFRMFPNRSSRAGRSYTISLLELRHKGAQVLAINLRTEISLAVQLLISLDQIGKLLFDKRQEHRTRARFQEERIGEDAGRVGLGSGLDYRLQIFHRIRDAGQNRRAIHTCRNSSLV